MYIHFLVKIFSEKEHADRFLNGEMYARRLSDFKKIEDGGVRGDKYEGALVLPREHTSLYIWPSMIWPSTGTGRPIRLGRPLRPRNLGPDLAAPPTFQSNRLNSVNVFCMHAAYTDESSPPQNLQDLMKQIEIPKRCLQLGRYAVFIKDTLEFLIRVRKAAVRRRYGIRHRRVTYYDPEIGTPHDTSDVHSLEAAFYKREEFAYQREYRFAIQTGTSGSDPITLDIGNIEDIAFSINTADINPGLKIMPATP